MPDASILEVFKGARIVATVPPPDDNGGWPYHLAQHQIAEMRACGAEVFPFDVGYSASADLGSLAKQIAQLSQFKPEVVVSTPGIPQVLRCRTGTFIGQDGWYVPNNLFVDNLGLPTIMMWDTMAYLFNSLRRVSLDPAESRSGVLAVAREQINHPLYFHCLFDQQHIDTLRALGVLTTPQVRLKLGHAYPNFLAYARAHDAIESDRSIIFAGNLFEPPPDLTQGGARETLAGFRSSVLRRFADDLGASYWDATERALTEIDPAAAAAAKLGYDETFFWSFLASDVVARVITENRLAAFRAARHPVDVYGMMHYPEAVRLLDDHRNMTYKGVADFDAGMPALYARSMISLDIVTAHFPTGTTSKILGCFAVGGFSVFNHKQAFADSFGDVGEQVMFRDFDEMNAKLEWFATHENDRRDVAAALRAHTLEHHTWIRSVAENLAWVREAT